jgi:hypothetical protein
MNPNNPSGAKPVIPALLVSRLRWNDGAHAQSGMNLKFKARQP